MATGEVFPEDRLVRFVLGPEDRIVPDVAAKLPGRGVWVCASRDAVTRAIKRGGFARSLKQPVQVAPGLADQIESLLARRCLDLLGLMRRAGAITTGFDQVEAAIRRARPHAMIEASDGAEDGREKLFKLALGLWGALPHLSAAFTASEMGVALGRDHVVHAVVLDERMAQRWAAETGRLSGFRAIVPASWPDSWRSSQGGRPDAGQDVDRAAPASGDGEGGREDRGREDSE